MNRKVSQVLPPSAELSWEQQQQDSDRGRNYARTVQYVTNTSDLVEVLVQ